MNLVKDLFTDLVSSVLNNPLRNLAVELVKNLVKILNKELEQIFEFAALAQTSKIVLFLVIYQYLEPKWLKRCTDGKIMGKWRGFLECSMCYSI